MDKERKIGIVSFHRDLNYGTMLQAFALQRAIENLEYACEYVNFFPGNRIQKTRNRIKIFLQMIGVIKRNGNFSFFYTPSFSKIRKGFNFFHKKYINSSKIIFDKTTLERCQNQYSKFIVGSDQTWSEAANPKDRFSPFFLDFVKDKNKKTSYAPSIGSLSISKDYLNRMVASLGSFQYLSCRERQNAAMLSDLLGREVNFVIDPTLLITSAEWENIMTIVKMPKQYILCYELGEKESISKFAELLGEEKKIPVYYVLTRPAYINKKYLLNDVTPTDFLWLIKNASYVITDSFHGTIFSINFNVNFYSFNKRLSEEGIDNDRIKVVLEEFGLSKRFREDNDTQFDDDIDFSNSNQILNRLRSSSKSYLSHLLNN